MAFDNLKDYPEPTESGNSTSTLSWSFTVDKDVAPSRIGWEDHSASNVTVEVDVNGSNVYSQSFSNNSNSSTLADLSLSDYSTLPEAGDTVTITLSGGTIYESSSGESLDDQYITLSNETVPGEWTNTGGGWTYLTIAAYKDIDDFEGTSVSNDYSGDTGSFSIQQSTVRQGSDALSSTTDGAKIFQDGSTSGFRSPKRGDNFYVWLRFTNNDYASIDFFRDNDSSFITGYRVQYNNSDGGIAIFRVNNGDETTLNSDFDFNSYIKTDEWIKILVETTSGGDITVEAQDSTGTTLGSGPITANDTTYNNNYTGFQAEASNGTIYYDSAFITEELQITAENISETITLSENLDKVSDHQRNLSNFITLNDADIKNISRTLNDTVNTSDSTRRAANLFRTLKEQYIADFPQNPLLYFPLQNISNSNTVEDLSGNNHDGDVFGASTTTGKYRNALDFDGNDYINVNNNISNLENWTVTGWIKPDNWNNNSRDEWLAVTENRTTNKPLDFVLENGSIKHYRGDAAGEVMSYDVSTETGWHQMTVTQERIDSSTVETLLYFDGVQVDSSTGNYENMRPSLDLNIGRITTDGFYWNGGIDEVRLYGQTLTSNEITALYNNPGAREKEGLFFNTQPKNTTLKKLVQPITVQDNVDRLANLFRDIQPTITINDADIKQISQTLQQTLSLNDNKEKTIQKTLNETTTILDALNTRIAILTKRLSETITVQDNTPQDATTIRRNISDTINIIDADIRQLSKQITQNLAINDNTSRTATLLRKIQAVITLNDTVSRQILKLRKITETITLQDQAAKTAQIKRTITQTTTIQDNTEKTALKKLGENIALNDTNQLSKLLDLTENLALNDQTTTKTLKKIQETITASDNTQKTAQLFRNTQETITLQDADIKNLSHTINQALTINTDAADKTVFRRSTQETLNLQSQNTKKTFKKLGETLTSSAQTSKQTQKKLSSQLTLQDNTRRTLQLYRTIKQTTSLNDQIRIGGDVLKTVTLLETLNINTQINKKTTYRKKIQETLQTQVSLQTNLLAKIVRRITNLGPNNNVEKKSEDNKTAISTSKNLETLKLRKQNQVEKQ